LRHPLDVGRGFLVFVLVALTTTASAQTLVGGTELTLSMEGERDPGVHFGAYWGLVAEKLGVGATLDAGFEVRRNRAHLGVMSRFERGAARLGLGYRLTLDDEGARHGFAGDVAVAILDPGPAPYFRFTYLPDGKERRFEVGARLLGRGEVRRVVTRETQDASLFGLHVTTVLDVDGGLAPRGTEARLSLTQPWIGATLGVGYDRLRLANQDGHGAHLSVAARLSASGLLSGVVPDLPRIVDLALEAGGSLGGVSNHGLVASLFAGVTTSFRLGRRGRGAAPDILLGYRVQLLQRPDDAATHVLFLGLGAAGFSS